MKDKKKIVIGTLCALIMIMTIGYALLSQQLSITGSASITSNWQVEITNITQKEKSTGATTNNTNYTATTASFNTSLTSPGDYALYEVTVTNKGTLDAVLSAKPTVTTGNNEAIQYELEGIKKGDKILKNNQTDTFTIKVQYNPSTTTQPTTLTSNIELTLNYEQDLGQIVTYKEYSVGDMVEFKETVASGSYDTKWYVIKDSTADEDYITVIRDRVLRNSQLGSYAYAGSDPEYTYETIAYYWSDTCHYGSEKYPHKYNTDTYTTTDTSGCIGHNDYDGSKIKEFLEQKYLPSLNQSALKEVNGYKIRLITTDEIIRNLGWTGGLNTIATAVGNNVPSWVYKNLNNGVSYGYWTMTPNDDDSSGVWYVGSSRFNDSSIFAEHNAGVRPVINLYKSAIE